MVSTLRASAIWGRPARIETQGPFSEGKNWVHTFSGKKYRAWVQFGLPEQMQQAQSIGWA